MRRINSKPDAVLTVLFLAVSCALYYFILTAGGTLLVATSYAAIVACFLYTLSRWKNFWIIGGLACTVGADFFLVICDPIQQLWGMVFFLGAQSLYAAMLHRSRPGTPFLVARIALTVIAEAITVAILKDNTDALALVSICYYVNLIFNIILAFIQFKAYKLFAIGLVFFLLCDTVIGLQVASGGYLPIPEGSALHSILFMPFNLSWFFYLPSQVLISLTSRKKHLN
ncbi:MAG: hypothetical protein IJZ15_03335 [Oscillospiraceae bacterium]|nr:hypothetical protein [Oscillospiraceae bacterium]